MLTCSRPKKALRGGDCARSVSVRQPRAFRSPSASLLKPSGHLRPFQSSILGPQVFKHAGPKVFRYARPSDVKMCFLVFDQGQPNHIFKSAKSVFLFADQHCLRTQFCEPTLSGANSFKLFADQASHLTNSLTAPQGRRRGRGAGKASRLNAWPSPHAQCGTTHVALGWH